MLPTGSKFLIGAAALAVVAAIVYGIAQGGSLGTTGLIFAAVALSFLAGVVTFTRDADVSSMDTEALSDSPAAMRTPPPGIWPIVAAVGGVLVVVGLVSYPPVFIFGIIALLGAAVEWMLEAWSERASADVAYNETVRTRLAHPLEFPLLALVAVGVIVYSFSRIMLWLSKTNGPALFAIIGALVLVVGFVVAFRPSIRAGAIGAVCSIAALGLVAGGASAAIGGERTIDPHETTGALASDGKCDDSAETEADQNSSQSVGAKANITAVVTLGADGRLTAKVTGLSGHADSLTITRANPTNILFKNSSSDARRLVLDLGTEPKTDEATGDTIPGQTKPNQRCTQLTDKGGTQLLTFSVAVPSWAAEQPYAFVVPGVDGAKLPVSVP